MKLLLSILIVFTIQLKIFGQKDTLKILNDIETNSVFTDKIKNDLGIKFPVFKTYEYNDKTGKNYLVLAKNGIDENNMTSNDTVQALNLIEKQGKLKIKWMMQDFVSKDAWEHSIWFWTDYISLQDLNNDGLIEPIIVYGTSNLNGILDGRIKILTYFKGNKIAIRHKSGVLDYERYTQVDKQFYEMPSTIQKYIKALMKKMMEDNYEVIFPLGWENAMKDKKLNFDEN